MAPKPKIDPELLRQLDTVAASDQPVEAVVRLRPDNPAEIVPSPERTAELTKTILGRVGKLLGNPRTRHTVFTNLGSFVVSAPTEFIRKLILQPEIAAVVANRQSDSAMIQPVDKKPVGKDVRIASPSKRTASRSSTKRTARTHKHGG
jgi:hypothetical protein